MKKISLILLTIAFVCTVSSCTKKSNCEMVEGHYVTGYFEYYTNPETANVSYIDDFNAAFTNKKTPKGYLVFVVDELDLNYNSYYKETAFGMIENSIPHKYRKDGLRVPVNATFTETEGVHFPEEATFKLLCIEEVE